MTEINQSFGSRLFQSLFVNSHFDIIVVLWIDNPLLIYFLVYDSGIFYDLRMNICEQTFIWLKFLLEKV